MFFLPALTPTGIPYHLNRSPASVWLTWLCVAEDAGSVVFVQTLGALVPLRVFTLSQTGLRASTLHVTHQNWALVVTVRGHLVGYPSPEAQSLTDHGGLLPAPAVHADAAPDPVHVDHDFAVGVRVYVIPIQRQIEACVIRSYSEHSLHGEHSFRINIIDLNRPWKICLYYKFGYRYHCRKRRITIRECDIICYN